jgi:hypothetical protein
MDELERELNIRKIVVGPTFLKWQIKNYFNFTFPQTYYEIMNLSEPLEFIYLEVPKLTIDLKKIYKENKIKLIFEKNFYALYLATNIYIKILNGLFKEKPIYYKTFEALNPYYKMYKYNKGYDTRMLIKTGDMLKNIHILYSKPNKSLTKSEFMSKLSNVTKYDIRIEQKQIKEYNMVGNLLNKNAKWVFNSKRGLIVTETGSPMMNIMDGYHWANYRNERYIKGRDKVTFYDLAVFQEFGTKNIPARPFFRAVYLDMLENQRKYLSFYNRLFQSSAIIPKKDADKFGKYLNLLDFFNIMKAGIISDVIPT